MERSGFTVVVPTFNEASGIVATLTDLSEHIGTLRSRYDVQLLVVDDGSSDGTVGLIEEFARNDGSVDVIEHDRNAGLVAAMRTGAEHARYDTLVFLDADLSYRPDIIEPLVIARLAANAAAALASPYMTGGVVANVPVVRLVASRVANWILARCAQGRLHTFTGMVRAYERATFLELFANPPEGEFNGWAVAQLLAAGRVVVEIPASLVWPKSRVVAPPRLSLAKLWDRMLLVFATASVLLAAIRYVEGSPLAEPLVLSTQPNGPYPSET